MGYPAKVQLIRRVASQQWYIPFPAALARALDLAKGETIEWTIRDRHTLILTRSAKATAGQGKKKRRSS
jgi:bifunctional DNA-binding transcriptional regulator/antitoxin component of YhaV-PrlF toxin-antitoxin module